VDEEVACDTLEYVPAAQSAHAVRPVLSVYLPAGQVWQTEAPRLDEKLPFEQFWQTELEVACNIVENLPTGHEEQAVNPDDTEYVPALQAPQVDDGDDAVQSARMYLPASHCVQEKLPRSMGLIPDGLFTAVVLPMPS
jgi:hypothetical protein